MVSSLSSMSGLAGATAPTPAGLQALQAPAARAPNEHDLLVREKFQDFVAGTFYKQMLKALRSTQGKPAYFHGGQAEEIFKSQMDEHVTDQLAKSHGEPFASGLFSSYAQAHSIATDSPAASLLDVRA
jgi:Rod binding domain-containing protein